MKPFDIRLAREVKPIKSMIGFTVILQLLSNIAFIAQSLVIAQVISQVFLQRATLASQLTSIAFGFLAWVCRVLLTSVAEWKARISGLRTVGALRVETLEKIAQISPQNISLPSGSLLTLLTRGIDGLEIYVARYLPQLILSALVPPLLTAVIAWLDVTSAAIIVVTIPLIPIFMALVGWFTQSNVKRHWQEVNRLAATIADLLDGLPELKIFGRSQGLAKEIRVLGEQQKVATMRVLSLSFLSAFVLELLATISVALIAVGIGVRLVNGEIELWRGLAALIMAPEVYAPLRLLGVHFHAAAEGLEAWEQLKAIRYQPSLSHGDVVLQGSVTCEWTPLLVKFGEHEIHIPQGVARPGSFTVVQGPSGCGKSTLLKVILGNQNVLSGHVVLQTSETSCSPLDIAEHAFSETFGYVGQDAWLGEGTIQDLLGAEAQDLLNDLGVDLPLDTEVSDRSQGISVGQRRRIAVAREMLRQPRILLLDEPAAALDDESETALIKALRNYAAAGHTVIAVAHRVSMVKAADHVVHFHEVAHAA